VSYTVLYGYLIGWAATSIGFAHAIRMLQDPVRPQSNPILLAVAAGIAWPLVVLGAAQMVTVALVTDAARSWKSRSIGKRARAFADNELDDLLDEWLTTSRVYLPAYLLVEPRPTDFKKLSRSTEFVPAVERRQSLVLGDLVQTTDGKSITQLPAHCPKGHS
jgi:hypothetical protein